MSNALAIAVVSGALQSRLSSAIANGGLTGPDAFLDQPSEGAPPGVYIKLVRVLPSPSLRNEDLPTRGADGQLMARPRLALNLHYLLSFVGSRATTVAEQVAGVVALELHVRPTLGPEEIRDYVAGADELVLHGSDLAEQFERVRFSPLALDNEELARLWGLYNQSHYALSVAYEASVVLIEPEVRPAAPLPVGGAGIYVLPAGTPRITRVRSSAVAQPVVMLGQDLIIRGSNLRGTGTCLRLGRRPLFPVDDELIGTDTLTFPLTGELELRAGVMAVQVVHRLDVDPGPAQDFRILSESNAVPFALLPLVELAAPEATRVGASLHEVRLLATPLPGADQEVELLLDRLSGGAHATSSRFRLEPGPRPEDPQRVVFSVAGLSAGDWLCRLRVDGALSIPRPGADGRYADPAVRVSP